MGMLERWAIGLVLLLALAGGSYWKGYTDGFRKSEREWALQRAEMEGRARRQADDLRAEGGRLAAELIEARARVKIEYVEVIRYVTRVARPDRVALDADITRVLNQSAGIRETVDGRPGGTAAPGAGAAADSDRSVGTSEKGVAEWIAQAVEMYQSCRLQATALQDFARACSR